MSNTLTALAPTLFGVADEVAAEPAGALDAVNMNYDSKGVAVGGSVTIPIAPVASLGTYTPAMTTTAGTDKTATSVTVTLSTNQSTSWNLTGEDIRSLENGDTNRIEWARQLVAQGMRAFRNAMAAAACTAIKQGGSRATGTAGTTPFAESLADLVAVRKILRNNGSPFADLQLVCNTDAYANMLNLGVVQQANLAGSDEERRQGTLKPQYGFKIREDANISAHTKGGGSSYVSDGIEAIGQTTLTVKTGSGTVLTGDIVTHALDTTNKYVVNTGITAAGSMVIGNPGLKIATADETAWTIGAAYTPSFAFERGAVVGVVRPPIIPAAPHIKQLNITDKYGLSYLLCEIVGDGMVTWRLNLAYVFQVIQSEFVALILG